MPGRYDAYVIGVDIGGTFTDCTVITPDHAIVVAKSPSTPDDLSRGFFDAIDAAAHQLASTGPELLAKTHTLAHGTTAGINALVTGNVANVALLATKGHGDTIRFMCGQGRILGASIEEILDYSISDSPDPVVPRERVFEITERVDFAGDVIVELQEQEILAALDRFAALDIEAAAIAYMWSFRNADHERRTAELIRQHAPELFVSCSYEVAPRIGELGRTVSTVVNAQIGPLMLGYVDNIVRGARERGFKGEVLFGQAEGGLLPADEAREFPIKTLQSGPVGGVVGSAKAGAKMGYDNIVVTDMGGTTLDVSTIMRSAVGFSEENELLRQLVYLRKVQVESVGAGGGSIAWIDDVAGTLRVGPRSAGAQPGPICYGRGGTEVTVTDADLVLGILNPDRPLAGGLKLDHAAALAGVAALGARLGLEPMECAAGVVEIVDSRMEDLVRRVTIARGHDPRDFALWAFGSASGAHAGLYGRGLGVREIVFPLNDTASVWSAYGLVTLDQLRSFETNLTISTPFDLDRIRTELADLEQRATKYASSLGLQGFGLERRADMKYTFQVFEVEAVLPDGDVDETWAERALASFADAYDDRYGAGSGYSQAGVVLTTLRVTMRVPAGGRALDALVRSDDAESTPDPDSNRDVFWRESGGVVSTPIYSGDSIRSGAQVAGPAVVEYPNTTIAVRPGQHLHADAFGNLVLRLQGVTS